MEGQSRQHPGSSSRTVGPMVPCGARPTCCRGGGRSRGTWPAKPSMVTLARQGKRPGPALSTWLLRHPGLAHRFLDCSERAQTRRRKTARVVPPRGWGVAGPPAAVCRPGLGLRVPPKAWAGGRTSSSWLWDRVVSPGPVVRHGASPDHSRSRTAAASSRPAGERGSGIFRDVTASQETSRPVCTLPW